MNPPPPPPPRNHGAGRSSLHSSTQATFIPPPPAAPKSQEQHEPYGQVNASFSGISHRRTNAEATSMRPPTNFSYGAGSSSSYAIPPSAYGKPSRTEKKTPMVNGKPLQYRYNAESLFALGATLSSILWWHESPIIIQIFLFVALILYGLDLVNSRDALAVAVWVAAFVLTIASGIGTLLLVDDADASGVSMIVFLLQLAVEGVFFFCVACWLTLQFQWLHQDVPSMAINMERCVHSLIPPLSGSILTFHVLRLLLDSWGPDSVAILSPHLFAFLMASGMLCFGCRQASYDADTNRVTAMFTIKASVARVHSMLLLLVPGIMHILTFRRRILSQYASFDEIFDLFLVWTGPYLLHCCVLLLPEKSPYEMSNLLFPKRGQKTLQGFIVPITASILASVAAQQRYLIPLCNAVSYQFNGHDLASTWAVSIYLTLSTAAGLFALWTWGRTSTVSGDLLFGEYHEDVVQLSICIGGLFVGKAFGMPWNLTPLPILAFLGLSVWLSTRMLRYLSIFLFVVHATGVVLFSYRFASINLTIPLPLPGVELGLVRFGMFEVFASVFIGLVAGLAVRPSGGTGAEILKRIDVAGICLVLYCLLLTLLELTLLKRQEPFEFTGQEATPGIEGRSYLYDHSTALMTSVLTTAVSMLLRRTKVITKSSWIVASSIGIGKALSVMVDTNELDGKVRSEPQNEALAQKMFYRAILSSLLLVSMMLPQATLKPIHIKSSARYKRSISDGRPMASIPKRAARIILLYCLVILPSALIASIPMVLTPLTMTLSSHYGGGAYYNLAPPLSEMLGFALALWGIACFSMLNHFLPDGGAEIWKRTSALILLMGVGVVLSAPALPGWLGGDNGFGVSNPYASISSVGTRLAIQGKSRTGGWGIVSASLATLLAITGPLELRERRHPSGRRDKNLLLRLMVFSVMFGSGVAWFITIQTMSQANTFVLAVTALCCMVVSFFGTVTCVLGYFLELESFDEVQQMAKVWFGSFWVFGIIAGVPSLLLSSHRSDHPFADGGWLAAYLSISCCVALALSLALRLRATKDQSSRGLGNLSCIASYSFATMLVYGRFGVAGVDHGSDVTSFFGVPASVFGTLLTAPMLLLLEGETSQERRSRVSRIAGATPKGNRKTLGINFQNLNSSNRFVPVVVAAVFVFFMASLYTVLVRGSFLSGAAVAEGSGDVLYATPDKLSAMARDSTSQSQALVMSARLADASIWTSNSIIGPIIHLCGILATVPSIFLLIADVWSGTNVPTAQIYLALPLNAIPVFFCKGTPTLRAAALIGCAGAIWQVTGMKEGRHRSNLRM
eukprot:scaffold8240_cov133-Cylindrotheca_fusiformis.AAC.10